ncbi:N-acetyl-D-Glu racemase DgcA [Aureimonas sp. ME7]|uniref:N-acetyl-D-Glu racemase DgcA n=1 Tax=Aureimonas sp. ME7 TaxID=2744252 RepID=UPI0015F516CC|nr:N-acetyl-D-Glu racemase DgcA [Aureimonas sp. ME7]
MIVRRLSVTVDRFPLARQFTIARGSKTEAVVVTCTVLEGSNSGRGECVPYARYGETVESVTAAIEGIRAAIEAGEGLDTLQSLLPPGAARNAVDCALWDLEAKRSGRSVAETIGRAGAAPVDTAFTISLGTPNEMARATREAGERTVLKVKVGGEGDGERMRAVRAAAPQARLIIDANEGWTPDTIRDNMLAAASIGAFVVEQPLPAGRDELLARMPRPVPVCADEAVHGSADLGSLVGRYDYVNLKLDKTGGLTEGLRFLAEARRHGFGVMVGCMVGSSLGMAPAVLLAQGAELVDLDGPLLLREDRPNGLTYEGSRVHPPQASLWG